MQLLHNEHKHTSGSCAKTVDTHQSLAWFDIGDGDFLQTGHVSLQGVRVHSHGGVTNASQNPCLK